LLISLSAKAVLLC